MLRVFVVEGHFFGRMALAELELELAYKSPEVVMIESEVDIEGLLQLLGPKPELRIEILPRAIDQLESISLAEALVIQDEIIWIFNTTEYPTLTLQLPIQNRKWLPQCRIRPPPLPFLFLKLKTSC